MRASSAKPLRNQKQKKIYFGRTALNNARKSFDEWKKYKDFELFSRLQHRIKTEFIKSKANDNFYKNDIRLNTAKKAVEEQKKLALLEAQLKNYEKFRNHSYLFGIQNEIKKMKINNYSNNYKKKEKKEKIIREIELEKKMKRDSEYPIDLILKRKDEIKKEDKEKNQKMRKRLKIKDLYLIKFKEKKDLKHKQKIIQFERILEGRKYRINQIITENNKSREELRKKRLKREEDINEFLSQKELINKEIRNINDDYNNRYHSYTGKIDHILYKRDLNKEALNQIKIMASFDPAISGLGQNLN